MVDSEAVRMTDDERDEFLESGSTGVLSFSTTQDEPPHSIPVSYGYDTVEEVFYFRLAVHPDSEKGTLENRPVAFVTHGQRDGVWKSVVADGTLRSTTAADVEIESLSGLERVHIPIVEVFGDPIETVEFAFYRLDPERLTARVETPVRE